MKARQYATDLEGIFISEEIHANKAKSIAAELRRLSKVEEAARALTNLFRDVDDVALQSIHIRNLKQALEHQ